MKQTKSEKLSLNKVLKDFAAYAKQDSQLLINHLRTLNYSDAQIAKILEISRQAMFEKYE